MRLYFPVDPTGNLIMIEFKLVLGEIWTGDLPIFNLNTLTSVPSWQAIMIAEHCPFRLQTKQIMSFIRHLLSATSTFLQVRTQSCIPTLSLKMPKPSQSATPHRLNYTLILWFSDSYIISFCNHGVVLTRFQNQAFQTATFIFRMTGEHWWNCGGRGDIWNIRLLRNEEVLDWMVW